MSTRNAREPYTVVITYRGGAECWWELKSGQGTMRFPGHLALHDVLRQVAGGPSS